MNLSPHRNRTRGLAALQRLVAPRPQQERCELCAAVVPAEHEHLVDPASRRLLCACQACAILFDHAGVTRYRRIPRDVRELVEFEIPDVRWNSLGIPIGLVFFFRSSAAKQIVAVFPSPGGPAEIIIDHEVWAGIASLHPSIVALSEDVEALLVNRMQGARDYYIVPIDGCYKLTGALRRNWTGISGGDQVWEEIRLFFDRLKEIARPARRVSHA